MTVLITLSGVGSSAGPTFDLYRSGNGITFQLIVSGINKTALEAGYQVTVADNTTDIKVTSVGACTNSYVATIGVIPTTTTTTTQSSIITGNICGLWQSDAQLMGGDIWENLTSGSVNFTSVLQSGELISTQEGFTSIQLNSYKSIDLNVYDITGNASITAYDGSNIVDLSFSNLQIINDDKPVDTLYFTGTIYTNYGRSLTVDITSQYGSFTPGGAGGGTSSGQTC